MADNFSHRRSTLFPFLALGQQKENRLVSFRHQLGWSKRAKPTNDLEMKFTRRGTEIYNNRIEIKLKEQEEACNLLDVRTSLAEP